jgi:hypothetical protein
MDTFGGLLCDTRQAGLARQSRIEQVFDSLRDDTGKSHNTDHRRLEGLINAAYTSRLPVPRRSNVGPISVLQSFSGS